tara:strand:+ start:477 stop:710 length:234 start_codon:yes stop_codon:yes gene_type:complete
MENITLKVEVKLATSLREFIDPMVMLKREGMLYFQKLSDGNLVPRVVTEKTERETLINLIYQKRAYIPLEKITAEQS